MLTFFVLCFLYLFAHCISDTVFQTPAMAAGKNRNREIDMSKVPKGQHPMNLWYMWLTHHAVVHGGMVFLVTYIVTKELILSGVLGMIESVSHWVIDFGKCDNRYSPIGDQLMHLSVKVAYVAIIIGKVY